MPRIGRTDHQHAAWVEELDSVLEEPESGLEWQVLEQLQHQNGVELLPH
jgi:hypothetical protein